MKTALVARSVFPHGDAFHATSADAAGNTRRLRTSCEIAVQCEDPTKKRGRFTAADRERFLLAKLWVGGAADQR